MSGSCVIICLIIGKICEFVNVCESRAIMIFDGGKIFCYCHKVINLKEMMNALELNIRGRIYQNYNCISEVSPKSKGGMKPKSQSNEHK